MPRAANRCRHRTLRVCRVRFSLCLKRTSDQSRWRNFNPQSSPVSPTSQGPVGRQANQAGGNSLTPNAFNVPRTTRYRPAVRQGELPLPGPLPHSRTIQIHYGLCRMVRMDRAQTFKVQCLSLSLSSTIPVCRCPVHFQFPAFRLPASRFR